MVNIHSSKSLYGVDLSTGANDYHRLGFGPIDYNHTHCKRPEQMLQEQDRQMLNNPSDYHTVAVGYDMLDRKAC